MEIIKITQNRERYLPLLLLADEQYDMLLKYLHRGDMYAMHEGGAAVAVCIVTDEGGGSVQHNIDSDGDINKQVGNMG